MKHGKDFTLQRNIHQPPPQPAAHTHMLSSRKPYKLQAVNNNFLFLFFCIFVTVRKCLITVFAAKGSKTSSYSRFKGQLLFWGFARIGLDGFFSVNK